MRQIIIVDDDQLVRTGIKALLADIPNTTVIAEASSGEEAISLIRELQPSLVLMDLNMPGMGGLEATRKVLQFSNPPKILILTAQTEDFWPRHLFKLGVSGYLTKNASKEELLKALEVVQNDGLYLNSSLSQQLAFDELVEKKEAIDLLSTRELQVLLMIAKGYDTSEIAEALHLAAKTICSYRATICEKLKLKNDVEISLFALRNRLVEID